MNYMTTKLKPFRRHTPNCQTAKGEEPKNRKLVLAMAIAQHREHQNCQQLIEAASIAAVSH